MSTVIEEKAVHNHKQNYGRYVADCPKCVENHPNGPPERKPSTRRSRAPRVVMEEKVAAMKAELREEIQRELAAAQAAIAPVEPTPAPEIATTVAAQSAGITTEQLMAAMQVLGMELRKGDPEVEQARAAAKLRNQIAKDNERKMVMERQAMREFEQSNCSHKMENGLSRIRGQEHGDGLLHEFCTWCQKAFPPRQISAQERAARMS